MTDRLGQQLGNYRLTRLLGQGGFAEVYQGEHTLLGTTAAIKVLHTQVNQEGLAPFQQEARLLANLNHPHIVPVLDFGVDGQIPYLVMGYAPHGTLRTRHPSGTSLPLPTVVTYTNQLAEALQYAHEHKVVHRDIKPENMLVGEQDQILLSDFGLALIAQGSRSLSTQNEILGTAAYMSPEQILGKPQPASDQYSLGIVLYEWLCGKRPFQGSFTELCDLHMFAPPSSLCDKVPTLSREVEQVVMTALAKEPKERFESMRALACALEQASQERLLTQNSLQTGTSSPKKTPTSSSAITATTLTVLPRLPIDAMRTSLAHADPLTVTPLALPATKTTYKPVVSRRTILIGASGAVIVAGGAGLFAVLQKYHQRQITSSQVLTNQGHLFFTYRRHSDMVLAIAWSPDGQRIASGSNDKTVQVWNASDGSHLFTYKGHSGPVNTVAWSPDGQRIVSGSNDKTVQVWNASDGSHLFTYKGHSDIVSTVAWSPDGQRIASGAYDNTVQVWNASNGNHAFTYNGYSLYVSTVAWSPDGQRIASGSYDNIVQVWNASNGSHAFTYSGHSEEVMSVAWSPDGQRIASGSNDKTVQVWNASDGSHAFTYKGHNDAVNAVAWSPPNGQRIVSGSNDKTVQVWNASDGSHAFTYKGHNDAVNAVAWSPPNGQRIVSGSDDKTAQVWQAV